MFSFFFGFIIIPLGYDAAMLDRHLFERSVWTLYIRGLSN